MIPSTDHFCKSDFWQNDLPDTMVIEIACLMPNGIMIPIKAYPSSTIGDIKEDLWETAKSYPLYRFLKEQSMYVISAISAFANIDEFNNESKRLCDIQPYFCVFNIIEKKNLTEVSSDNEFYKVIGLLIGRSLEDFKKLKNSEVKDFRLKMSILREEIMESRCNMSWYDRLMYQNPPRLAKTAIIQETIKSRHPNGTFLIVVRLENDDNWFTLYVEYNMTPHRFLNEVLSRKLSKTMNHQKIGHAGEYILKVFGREEYLFGDYPLIQFVYIQETLSNDGVPSVVMKSIHKLETYTENHINEVNLSSNSNKSSFNMRKQNKNITSWNVNSNFKLRLHSIENLNCDLNKKVGVHLGLFHGDKTLCASKQSFEHSIGNDKTIVLDEEIVFDINLQNIPRMTRLCIGIYEGAKSVKQAGSKTKRVKDNKEPCMNNLAWVNVTLFDFKDELKSGTLTLFTWNYADNIQSDEIFNSLGTVEQNPRTEECAAIKLSFHNYDSENIILYPSEEIVLQYAAEISRTKSLNRDSAQDTRTIKQILEPYLSNDRLYEMHDQERNAIWAKRLDCLTDAPYALPLLLHCVEWNKRDEVSEICRLLKKWPTLSVERALELLDYTYPDPTVRGFAINCLKELRDEELLLYLLQLVQAIKHECYLDCELVKFLLRRALQNQRIGHYFFWHLKSEMQMPAMQIRFGLILEAYLQGSQTHIPLLYKQFECLEKLRQGSELARKGNKEKVKSSLQDFLTKERNGGVFANLLSPLNPYFRCKGVKPEKCKIMDSKMRPLWIVFENADTNGDDIHIIFKNGDDLRQDMLTLQMLRVMDQLWKNEGYDFRMNIYGCISMERRMGMIEVVLNAETIANIQKEKGMFSATSPFKKGSLLSWLKEHNSSEESLEKLEKAIKEFTYSCAGYCVATYVLGVADRHSDNIMVKKTGQLFHIDFGHILGHFKEKFGVRRERVPFVLTHDFVYVINNGRTERETEEFRTFQNLCETAFLILRRHGCLILSLFAMMISTGLPELSSEKDLNYLKETLVLDLTEESAREHFRSKFNEALANSWKTSLNWMSHNFSKNNKQ
ncbi:phosphatidylinositol 4,5-bisphosphate 3-kinase catalytic subunit beta isoform [Condylostylus longicornis]|uniref:phosphatidylinositol 4,5-bisphosphate 3-kinase catalytic subunit beta isoform n=1 Tax=Condylostylus longicornis TaxID=2530218 RepID=UPI00244DC54A|nr:phosphatidylinositol 4,5-bisphosphate 3-kinase catalytic subunit beta isoform [Condylostylus longicornis]